MPDRVQGARRGARRCRAQRELVARSRRRSSGPPGARLDRRAAGATRTRRPRSTRCPTLRAVAKRAGGEGVLVGGPTAQEYDLRQSAARDNRVIIPITLVVVFLILACCCARCSRRCCSSLSVILSFAAALGVGVFVSDVIFGFPGIDPSLPLLCFVFLVALGIDYNIFLMARVREETLRYGTREGMLRGLAVTGAVITGAGIVLAGHVRRARRAAARLPDRDRLHRRLRRAARHVRRALGARAGARARHRAARLVAVAAREGRRAAPLNVPV